MHIHKQLIGFLHYSGLECSDWILLDTLVSLEPHTSLGVMWFCQFWGIYKLKRVFISVLKYQKNMSSKDVKELFLFLVLYFLMHFLKLFLAILLFDCFSSDTKVLLYFIPKIYLMLQLWKSSHFALPLSILQALLNVCPLNFCSIYFC